MIETHRTSISFWGLPLLLAFCLLMSGVGQAASNETNDATLKGAEQKLEEARKERERLKNQSETLAYELQNIRREMISSARSVQSRESEITRIEARLGELVLLEKQKIEVLKKSEGGMSRILAALVRMTRNPPGAMLFQPASPADTVRGAILLRAALPAMEQKATRLKRDLLDLVYARTEMAKRSKELTLTTAALTEERMRLDRLLELKTALKRETDQDQGAAEQEVHALALKAQNLRDLLGKLEQAQKNKPVMALPRTSPDGGGAPIATESQARPFSQSRGLVSYPVSGRLIGSYGEKLESGLARKGLSLETRPGAQVIAPFDGLIVFAGLFRGYGHLLIIEHGEGYHSLLAGMARIDVDLGQTVLAGEPVGVMDSSRSGEGDRPVLYVELRRNSQPINPTPWLLAHKEE